MGQQTRAHLTGRKIYGCGRCGTHLTTVEALLSKRFTGKFGQATLFYSVVNVLEGPPEDRRMTTGLHTVVDLRCLKCETYLGWKYIKSFEQSEKYKENCFLLERALLQTIEPGLELEGAEDPISREGNDSSTASNLQEEDDDDDDDDGDDEDE
ncbi:Predicted Yippee-type zinc-binding protein [Phaffia rhodozyma]|uniref:Protein yippee-like n=1 Tax=Phaffia rhodozyma TaxID=264483 RepID=A0A0F7SWU1_PHARH|nr:Predicted Yippee-type zinc-binding protein [Phaffia rhodozyma]